jgi:hypothetical protein
MLYKILWPSQKKNTKTHAKEKLEIHVALKLWEEN